MRPPRVETPLIGYCDICGTSTNVVKGTIGSDNQTKLYKYKGSDGNPQVLCYSHYTQETRNNSRSEAVDKQTYKDRLYSAFQTIFPYNNKP